MIEKGNQPTKGFPLQAKALLTLASLNMAKTDDLGAVETALKNATEAFLVLNQTPPKLTQLSGIETTSWNVIVIERFFFGGLV